MCCTAIDYKKAQQDIKKMSVDIPKLQKRSGKGMKNVFCFYKLVYFLYCSIFIRHVKQIGF